MPRFAIIVARYEEGFSAYVPDLPGVIANADSLEKARQKIREVISQYVKDVGFENLVAPSSACEYVEVGGDGVVNAVEQGTARNLPASSATVHPIKPEELWWDPHNLQKDISHGASGEGDSHPLAISVEIQWGRDSTRGMDFVLIPAGEYQMGSPVNEVGRHDGEVLHTTILSETFFMKATPVTHGEWKAVMGTEPSKFKYAGALAPVEMVSWFDAIEFCNTLSTMEGLEPVYRILEPDRRSDGSIRKANVSIKPDTRGYRIPSEAQWEFACRAGTKTSIYSGEMTPKSEYNCPELDVIAWYGGNSEVKYAGAYDAQAFAEKQRDFEFCGTHTVRQKLHNGFGLFDMIGNVWEWCWDRYGPYQGGKAIDPIGPVMGRRRVFRGGSWSSKISDCRSAMRCKIVPRNRASILGFRVIRDTI